MVAAVGAAGAALATVVMIGAPITGRAVLAPTGIADGWLTRHWLIPLLLVVTIAGELTAVRVRRGTEVDELTLFEAVVVVDALLLRPAVAIVVPLLALVLAEPLRGRPLPTWPRSATDVGCKAASMAVLVAVVRTLAVPGELGARTLLALCVGTLSYGVVSQLCLAGAGVPGLSSRAVLVERMRLSAVLGIVSAGLGAMVVAVAAFVPVLLPFTALPAVSLTYAYRAAGLEAEERERSGRLLALSEVLAGRLAGEHLVESFLTLAREAFGAEYACAILNPGSVRVEEDGPLVVEVRSDGVRRRAPDHNDLRLVSRAVAAGRADLVDTVSRAGPAGALLATLDAEGARLGVVVIGSRGRRRPGRRELSLFTPLASALAAALRSAQHSHLLLEETSKLATVVEQSSDGILVVDGAGVVQVWNPALSVLVGRNDDEALGLPLSLLLTAVDTDGEPVDAFLAGRQLLSPDCPRATLEMAVVRPDGERRWVRFAHAAVFDGDLLLRDVVIAHDVTRERQVERLKSDFIATVSHELRTPVTPIKGYAELLRRRGDAMTAQKRAECVEIIADRADHLARLVEDLLLASRITSPQAPAPGMQLESADLVALTLRAVGDFSDSAERITLALPDRAVPVACDPLRVVQVLTNLLSNALKYSGPTGRVEVTLAVAAEGVRVCVSDEGRGIPADHLERVFEKFHRVEDPMRMTTSGTGLGLYIARQLAGGMGGQLRVTSTLGVGSTFTFSLPAIRPLGPLATTGSDTVGGHPGPGPQRTAGDAAAPVAS